MELPPPVYDLPEGHIFKQIYREYKPQAADDEDWGAQWSDLRRPIDIQYVIARLQTPEGRSETRQWVKTATHSRRLFLHQLMECKFEINHDDSVILCVHTEDGISAINLALEVYPDSIRLADSDGCLPLHITCVRSLRLAGGSSTAGVWNGSSKRFFNLLLDKYPDGACTLTASSKSVLSCVLGSQHTASGTTADEDRDSIIMTLLDLFPRAAEIPDSDGRYPIHVAAHAYAAKPNVLQRLIKIYPQALEKTCNNDWGGKTPLLSYLRCVVMGISIDQERTIRMLMSASPSSTWIEDYSVLTSSQDLDPAGDALDYASVKYIVGLKVFSYGLLIEEDEDQFGDSQCVGGFALANEECLMKQAQTTGQDDLYRRGWHEDDLNYAENTFRNYERLFELVLRICQLLDGSVPFRPLHAFCKGRRCRPWYLAIMDQIIKRHLNEAKEKDEDNNLPIHLFLESCMVEKERARIKGYISGDDEYFRAVQVCFKLILDAYPGAANERNADGLFPVHIAIRHCNHLKFEDILQPLLELAPTSLLARDKETKLHPFAQASIGSSSNVDTVFILLRRDPSVLATL